MFIERPPLLRLGGEEALPAYEAEFRRRYLSGPVFDVLGKRVLFHRTQSCRHVCLPKHDDQGYKTDGTWRPERAERIPWIHPALSDPRTEVRKQNDTGNFQYLCIFDREDESKQQEPYVVIASPSGEQVFFVTAYPLMTRDGEPDSDGWRKMRRRGTVIWIPK